MNLLDLPLEMLIEIYKNTSYVSQSFIILRADLLHTCKYLAFDIGDRFHSLFRYNLNVNDVICDLEKNDETKHWNDENQVRCYHCNRLPRSDKKPCCTQNTINIP